MKRRVISFITVLAMCLSLCPMQALAVGWEPDTGLCPHHQAHTEECGYVPPTWGRDCTHEHDESCFIRETLCVHQHTEDCCPKRDPDSDAGSDLEPSLCTHECTEASGCVVLTAACSHVHNESCSYAPEDAGAPCTFACRVCPIEDLINALPRSVTPENQNQAADQLSAILTLYAQLTADEQDQLDLSRCLDLQAQLDAANAPALIDSDVSGFDAEQVMDLYENTPNERLFPVTVSLLVDTHGYSYTAPKTGGFQVQSGGGLCVTGGGTIEAQKGSGVEVLTGGQLYVSDASLTVTGSTYGLDIASGAAVELSGGTYTGRTAAIRTADQNFDALLKPGCAYFDVSGNPIPLTDVAAAKTVVVKECTVHQPSYTHNAGTPTHDWTCAACGTAAASEPCAFVFDQSEEAACICGNVIAIAVNEADLANLVYDGSLKPGNIGLTVTLKDGSDRELTKDADYTVDYEPRKDAGEITVTVTGRTYSGTFTKTYYVTQAQPSIHWNSPTCGVDYSGSPVTEDDLPGVTITAFDDLSQSLRYSYKGANDTEFTDGLPTNAGTYEIKASLAEQQNYEAAETNPCLTLTIRKIPAVITAPAAIQPFYNSAPQNLVTAGTVHDGAVIEFAQNENGPYSAGIPAETNAGGYRVWYRVADTENYIGVSATEIAGVQILRKPVTPTVELSAYTYLYDGGEKEPAVTVMDGETQLPKTEYQVNYFNNRNVSTAGNPARAEVTDAPLGNYEIKAPGVTVEFEITILTQAALTITGKRDTVTYGDRFTLNTSGGSGSGDVTWEIIRMDSPNVATVNKDSGQVTITGCGTATVRATKSGAFNGVTNYEDATAVWTFTAEQKPVVATVTAEDKVYTGTSDAKVHAVVEQGVLPGDEITIEGLTGQFSDGEAGTDKTVTVNKGAATISGTNWEHYAITYSSAPVKANITKAPASIKNPPTAKTLTYNGSGQALVEAGEANIAAILLEYALDENGPYSTNIPEAADAGRYEVWYRVPESPNYTGTEPDKVPVTILPKPVTPTVELSGTGLQTDAGGSFYIYDGNAKTPSVTVKDGADVIPAGSCTVSYRDNVNAGMAEVTVTAKTGGNYTFQNVTAKFEIRKAEAKLTSPPLAKSLIYTGDPQELVTVGIADNGKVVYCEEKSGSYTSSIPEQENAGTYTVWYKVQGDSGYNDTEPHSVQVTIQQKPVINPVITLGSFDARYDGIAKTPSVTVVDNGKTIASDQYTVGYSNNTNAGTATVTIRSKNAGNYVINDSVNFEITKAKAEFTTDPEPKNGLAYNGKAQPLITGGIPKGGTAVYSLNDGTYSPEIPTGTNRDTYTVSAKVMGDANHEDSEVLSISVPIAVNLVTNPTISLSANRFQYNGSEQKPTVTVKDDNGALIPADEYTVEYDGDTVKAGAYTIKITSKEMNYSFAAETRTVTILAADQTALSITGKPNAVYYGDTIQLGTTGGSGNGAVTWSIEAGTEYAVPGSSDGQFRIIGVGRVTIKATRTPAAGSNYAAVEDTWEFYADRKPVTAVVTAKDKEYDTKLDATLTVAVPGTTIVIENVPGTFDSPDAGTGKTVTISSLVIPDTVSKYYDVSYSNTATASITPKTASVSGVEGKTALTYTGAELELVTPGTATGGDVVYSLNGTDYDHNVPTGVNAGKYKVWYKALAGKNYKDSDPDYVDVEIGKADPPVGSPPTASPVASGQPLSQSTLTGSAGSVSGSFAWVNGDVIPEDGKLYPAMFIPDDAKNYNTLTFDVAVTVTDPDTDGDGGTDSTGGSGSTGDTGSGGTGDTSGTGSSGTGDTGSGAGNSTNTNNSPAVSAPMQTTVQNGTAATVLNTAAGDKLVREAAANQSTNVVIKPEIAGDVTKTSVSIPTSTVSQLGSKTNADLTVSTPVADVTIPNAALDTLSSAGGTVNVVTEQVENAVALTLSAGGQNVEYVPGGLTLTVPAQDAGPGTVAVLVHEDGTRETVRKAVAEDGKISVPLDGPATVEVVDNSKEFTDVPAENWAADAVAFASAHELFNGTSETTFSPDEPMSRAMLATVLYNLEGRPAQSPASGFGDVSSDAWYAEGVAWAAENGITNGYSDDQFGPNDSVTREQFAVMLWKYAGSPASNGEALGFTDADQVSSYAIEALRWAAANGILNGYDNGRLDPSGPATRAQAAQMLKNFMENT